MITTKKERAETKLFRIPRKMRMSRTILLKEKDGQCPTCPLMVDSEGKRRRRKNGEKKNKRRELVRPYGDSREAKEFHYCYIVALSS